MTRPPAAPKLYHITHVSNLPNIIKAGGLRSDALMLRTGGPVATIGMSKLKRRRLYEIPVYCHPGSMVGDYVPFYFCPRSVMLYIIHCANDPDLTYRQGQGDIVHLEADLREVLDWADEQQRPWAFSLSNAAAYHVQFRNRRNQLSQINWEAVAARMWSSPSIKEAKQAEFLLHDFFPWQRAFPNPSWVVAVGGPADTWANRGGSEGCAERHVGLRGRPVAALHVVAGVSGHAAATWRG